MSKLQSTCGPVCHSKNSPERYPILVSATSLAYSFTSYQQRQYEISFRNAHPILIYNITRSMFYFVLCNSQKLDEHVLYQPECVSHRSPHDIIYQDQQTNYRCILDTYVIEENRCVKNDNFFESKLTIIIICIYTLAIIYSIA